jgi:hypothetical protein
MDKGRPRARLGRALSLLLRSEQPMGRRKKWILATGLVAVLAAWFVVKAAQNWEYSTELRLARRDLRAQQFDAARVRLALLAQRWPGQGEVEYPLGTCESLRGHSEAALAAWGRVPDRAIEAPLAALSRGELAIGAGRYRLAETCLERVIRTGGDLAIEARRLLGHLHWITGRQGEYRNLLQREFEHTRDPAETLRLLWSLDHEPYIPLKACARRWRQRRRQTMRLQVDGPGAVSAQVPVDALQQPATIGAGGLDQQHDMGYLRHRALRSGCADTISDILAHTLIPRNALR